MLNGLPVAQIIAIGQTYMAKNTGLSLQPRGIEILAQKILEQPLAQTLATSELQFMRIISLLSTAQSQPWFSVGTPMQRQLWCDYWTSIASQLSTLHHQYQETSMTLPFKDWVSRQPISEQVWSLFSNGVTAIEQQQRATLKDHVIAPEHQQPQAAQDAPHTENDPLKFVYFLTKGDVIRFARGFAVGMAEKLRLAEQTGSPQANTSFDELARDLMKRMNENVENSGNGNLKSQTPETQQKSPRVIVIELPDDIPAHLRKVVLEQLYKRFS